MLLFRMKEKNAFILRFYGGLAAASVARMKPLEIRIEKYLKEHTGKRVHPVAVAKKFNLFTHSAIVRLRRAGGFQLVILTI